MRYVVLTVLLALTLIVGVRSAVARPAPPDAPSRPTIIIPHPMPTLMPTPGGKQ